MLISKSGIRPVWIAMMLGGVLGSSIFFPIGENFESVFDKNIQSFFLTATDDNTDSSFISEIKKIKPYYYEISKFLALPLSIIAVVQSTNNQEATNVDVPIPTLPETPTLESPFDDESKDSEIGSGDINEDKTIFISAEYSDIISVFDFTSLILEKNQSPIAKLQAEGIYVVYETIGFSAAGSSDPDGNIIDYHWDYGDGTEGFGPVVSKKYQYAGTYTVKLTVTNDFGNTNSDSIEFFVSPKIAYRIIYVDDQKSREVSLEGNRIIEWFFGEVSFEKSNMIIDFIGNEKLKNRLEYAFKNLDWKEITLVEIAVQHIYDPLNGEQYIQAIAFPKSYDSEENLENSLSAYTFTFN